MSNSTNYTESLFQAIELLAEKRIANLDYDKTIICTITDISNAKNNKYKVSDGNIEFTAEGDGNKYNVNDSVRVLVLNGDFSDKKFIQGKYNKSDNAKPITYVSPLGSVLQITDNYAKDLGSYELAATGDNKRVEICLDTFDLTTDDIYNKDIYDTMYLKASFYSGLDQLEMRDGEYGLHLVLLLNNDNKQYDRRDLFFSSKRDMIGDTYAFKIFTNQEITYQLSSWPDNVIGAKLYFYQEGNFKYYDYNDSTVKPLNLKDEKTNTEIKPLRVKDIYLGFGSELSKVDDNLLKIYTNDSAAFDSSKSNDSSNNKTIKLLWYNKTADNEYIGFSDGIASFSDDIYGNVYDEFNYQKEIQLNNRLISAVDPSYPKDKNCLYLAADIKDIAAEAKKASNLIGKDLYQTIRAFRDYTLGINWGENTNPFLELLSTDESSTTSLGYYSDKIDADSQILSNYYAEILQAANKKIVPDFTDIKDPGGILDFTHEDYITNLQTRHTNLTNGTIYALVGDEAETITGSVNTLLNTLDTQTSSTHKAYRDIYDLYKRKIDLIISDLRECATNIINLSNKEIDETDDVLTKDNSTRLADLSVGTNVIIGDDYTDKRNEDTFKKKWDNRYAIYWYQKIPGNTETPTALSEGWKRLTEFDNYGLPTETENGYYKKKPGASDEKGYISVTLNRKVAEEIFKVVIYYNHEKFVSPELKFTNNSSVIDESALDSKGGLSILNHTYSYDTYQLYGDNGLLLNAGETQKKRELKVDFKGQSGGNEQLIDAYIYWYVPNASTMLTVFNNELQTSDGWYSDRLDIYKDEIAYNDAYMRKKIAVANESIIGPYAQSGSSIIDQYDYCSHNKEEIDKQEETYTFYETMGKALSKEVEKDTVAYIGIEENKRIVYKKYKYNSTEWELITGNDADSIYKFKRSPIVALYSTLTAAGTPTKEGIRILVGPNNTAEYTYYESVIDNSEANPVTYKYKEAKNLSKIKNLTETLINSAIYKEGYTCYYRQIKQDTEYVSYLTFPYHVKDYYDSTATQNVIYCQVKKNNQTFYAEKYFTFSSFGNSGTDYTLALTPDETHLMVTNDSPLIVNINLYDQLGQEIAIGAPSLTYDGPTGYKDPVAQLDTSQKIIGCKIEKDSSNNIYAGILKCSINNVSISNLGQIDLTSYFSIPYSPATNRYIEGASTIVYDSLGANPNFYKKPYTLYDTQENRVVDGVDWHIRYYYNKGEENWDYYTLTQTVTIENENTENEKTIITFTPYDSDGNEIEDTSKLSINYVPKLTSSNILQPAPIYIKGLNIYPVAIAIHTDDENETETLAWAQPIIIIQNRYSSNLINEWNGELKIDNDNNTILSAMMGAGVKNDDNSFSGILMGDIKTNEDTAIGLYGYHNGAQSFGFKVDGTAFIGKSGKGRILFDGTNNSTITSSSYDLKNISNQDIGTGMKLDLDDGWLSIKNSGKEIIHLDNKGNDNNPYLCIKNIDEKILLNIQDTSYYLQSANYLSKENAEKLPSTDENYNKPSGMKINLVNGYIDAYNFKLTSRAFTLSNSHVTPANGAMKSWYDSYVPKETEEIPKSNIIFKAKDLFAITDTGYLFTDDIYANTKGQIGGWEIDGYRLLAKEENNIRHAGMAANSGHGCWAFWAGEQHGDGTEVNPYGFDAPFHVGHAGELYCDNITATGGLIGKLQIKPDGSLSSEYLTISQNQVHFKTASSFQMTDDFSITNNITGSDNDAIIMQTFGTYKFYIQNAEGAGIVFHNNEVNEGSSTSLIIKNINIVERVQGSTSYVNIYYDIDYDFTFDYEWVNEVPVATEFPISITLQASRGRMRYPWDGPPYYEPEDYYENTVYYVIPVDPTTGFGQKSGSCSFTNVVHIDASGDDSWRLSGIRRAGTSNNFVSTGGSFTYHTSSTSGKNDILYSIGSFAPLTGATNANTGYFLGDERHLWNSVYAYTAAITASDKRFKSNINNISQKYELFYNNIKPVTYNYINGTSNRTHIGFIAQDIEKSLKHAEINTQEFAGICIGKDSNQHYFLRYEEFIPLNTWQIQKLKPRMTEAEERIYKLEQELAELKQQLLQ